MLSWCYFSLILFLTFQIIAIKSENKVVPWLREEDRISMVDDVELITTFGFLCSTSNGDSSITSDVLGEACTPGESSSRPTTTLLDEGNTKVP